MDVNRLLSDEQLLRDMISSSDNDSRKSRAKFYLAQTLTLLGKYLESIYWYEQRLRDGGWAEEVYQSKFQIGYNYELLAKEAEKHEQSDSYFQLAIENYLDAYKYRKTRAEALFFLMKLYFHLGMYEKADEVVEIGKEISYNTEDAVFIDKKCYGIAFVNYANDQVENRLNVSVKSAAKR